MQFQAKVNISGKDFDGECEINYDVELELRSWGIKDIYVSVPDQEVEFYDSTSETDKIVKIENVEVDKDFLEDSVHHIQLSELELYDGQWTAS